MQRRRTDEDDPDDRHRDARQGKQPVERGVPGTIHVTVLRPGAKAAPRRTKQERRALCAWNRPRMSRLNDVGGMHGFGAIERVPDEPPFHAEWEARVFALNRL